MMAVCTVDFQMIICYLFSAIYLWASEYIHVCTWMELCNARDDEWKPGPTENSDNTSGNFNEVRITPKRIEKIKEL